LHRAGEIVVDLLNAAAAHRRTDLEPTRTAMAALVG
jgi:hypothetical protein